MYDINKNAGVQRPAFKIGGGYKRLLFTINVSAYIHYNIIGAYDC